MASFTTPFFSKLQRFKGSKFDAYKPSGLHTTMYYKKGQNEGKGTIRSVWHAQKISAHVLPLANNSTMNSELTRGEMAGDKVQRLQHRNC